MIFGRGRTLHGALPGFGCGCLGPRRDRAPLSTSGPCLRRFAWWPQWHPIVYGSGQDHMTTSRHL